MDDVPINILPSVGQQLNVGGYDGVGVKLYSTSGIYNTRVIESYGYYSDGDNDYYNYNPSVCDGSKGAFFEYQDKAVVTATSGLYSAYQYNSKYFSAMIVYEGSFGKFSGYARTQYVHTWSNSQIESVSFGASGSSPVFQVNISNSGKSFSCFSPGETKF